jgi:DNA-binding transcriptional regulator YiaG
VTDDQRVEELLLVIDALGVSQREAADLLEINPRTVRYWVAGNPPPPLTAIYALRYLQSQP